MDIAFVFNSIGEISGDKTQSKAIIEKSERWDDINIIPIAKSSRKINTDKDYIDIDNKKYPTNDLSNAVQSIDPDFVFYNALSKDVYEAHDKLKGMYPTIYRMSANLVEQSITQGFDDKIKYLINFLKTVDIINPPSKFVKDNLKKIGIRNVSEPIPPMVTNFNQLNSLWENKGNDIITTMARYSGIKNLHTTILAVNRILEKYPKLEYHLHGDKNLYDKVKPFLEVLSCRDRIKIFKPEPTYDIFQKSTFYIQLSLSENHSTTIAEARVSGTPLLVSQSMNDDINEIYNKVEPDNIKQIVNKFDKLYEGFYYNDNMFYNKTNLEQYKPENVLDRYKQLFNKIKNLKKYKMGEPYNIEGLL